MDSVISVSKLTKAYKDNKVLEGVDFKLERGQILALLGPNGAGKTTTINILSTLLRQDSGSAIVNQFDVEKDPDKVRESIGLTGQFAAIDEYLTGRENIKMIAKLYHMDRVAIPNKAQELLEKFDLVDAGDTPARTYSGGMKRRLDLAMSLVASPSILFLDEPTTGLDPRSRLTLWEMVRALADEGMSILLTTQYMDEAENLADNVIVLDQGKIIAEGTVNELKTKAGSERIEIVLKNDKDVEAAMKLFGKAAHHSTTNDVITIPAKQGSTSLVSTIEKLKKAKIPVDTIGLRKPTLDDVFLALTGHKAESVDKQKGTKNA